MVEGNSINREKSKIPTNKYYDLKLFFMYRVFIQKSIHIMQILSFFLFMCQEYFLSLKDKNHYKEDLYHER